MECYRYTGPVMIFGKVVQEEWVGDTYAVSEAKARNNLAYRWKQTHGRTAGAKVTLPGKIEPLKGGLHLGELSV